MWVIITQLKRITHFIQWTHYLYAVLGGPFDLKDYMRQQLGGKFTIGQYARHIFSDYLVSYSFIKMILNYLIVKQPTQL